MCVTAAIAAVSVAASAMGLFSSIQSANAAKDRGRYLAQVEAKQAQESYDNAKLQALQQEVGRTEQFNRERSSALAAIGSSGQAQHLSFAQGIDPANQENLDRDIRSIRLNLIGEGARYRDERRTAGYNYQMAGFNAKMQKIGAVGGFIKDTIGAASYYQRNSTGA